MNPDNYQYPVDYLNKISAPSKKSGMNNKLLFILAGGGVLVAILVFFGLMSASKSTSPALPTLAARLETLQTISTNAQKNLKSSSLRSTNSNLTLFLTGANHDLEAPLLNSGVDMKKLDKKLLAREKNEALVKKLEDARLNGIYDRTYAREMNYELQKLSVLMQQVYSSTKSKSFKTTLEGISKNLTPIYKELDEFSASTS